MTHLDLPFIDLMIQRVEALMFRNADGELMILEGREHAGVLADSVIRSERMREYLENGK